MVLVCDIGNTNINIGIFQKRRLLFKGRLLTVKFSQFRHFLNTCLKSKKIHLKQIESAIICSVVPKLNKTAKKEIRNVLKIPINFLGKNLSAPITNLYSKPKQVGQDRLVNAYAGVMLYGAPLVIVDFGTAITFDAISKNKAYLGGMILPGLGISLDALSERTALLPKVRLSEPKEFIGRDTKNSMISGIVYGFAALTDDLSERIKNKIGKNAKVIGTGGNIDLISGYCKKVDKIDEDLTLKGLNLIYCYKKRE